MSASLDRNDGAGVVIADATAPGFPLIYASPGFEALTGYRAEQVLGGSCAVLQGPDTDPRAVGVLRGALAGGQEVSVTLLNYRADGSSFWNEVTLAPERDTSGRVARFLGVQRDVSGARAADARLAEVASHDPLTGLANRASLQTELDDAVALAAERTRQLALLCVDVDDFRHVNETHGHALGDRLLRELAGRLRGLVRPSDLLARTGGDEFLVLMRDVSAADVLAASAAARVVTGLRLPFALGETRVGIRASVGVSVYPDDAATGEELLGHADSAMRAAKRSGRDGFHIHRRARPRTARPIVEGFDPAGAAAADELSAILAAGSVTSVFQPIVEIASGRTTAYEALTRGPDGSPLQAPDRLFAAAEAAGRVEELDWQCRLAAVGTALESGLGRSASLFLNCEPSAIGSPCPESGAALWQRAIEELDIVLEITERAMTSRPAELSREIARHRAQDCGVALDDLGADVRSLALLPLIEPDVIKLDLRLVQDRPSTEQAAIVSAVAAERSRTGAIVLAEGVETPVHREIATALGASLGQGWLWGRPASLPPVHRRGRLWRHRIGHHPRGGRTPFEVVRAEHPTAQASKRLLLPMSQHLENHALRIGEGAVVLSTFQDAAHFTPATRRRYETLAHSASLCGALGVGLAAEPAPGVRGAQLAPEDPLAAEWDVVVLGPHFAGALVARDLGDTSADRDRRFQFVTVYDRGLVIAAARTLLERLAPVSTLSAA